jgi:hypothetical protein
VIYRISRFPRMCTNNLGTQEDNESLRGTCPRQNLDPCMHACVAAWCDRPFPAYLGVHLIASPSTCNFQVNAAARIGRY